MLIAARRREADRARVQRVAQLDLHRRDVGVGARLVEGALAHDVGAQRGVPDVGRVVDALGQRVDGVEVFAEGGPRPVDAGRHRRGRDVFGAFEVAHDQRALFGARRREGETAVAHDGGRRAVPRGAGAEMVPEDLRVHVRVTVDEARASRHGLRRRSLRRPCRGYGRWSRCARRARRRRRDRPACPCRRRPSRCGSRGRSA